MKAAIEQVAKEGRTSHPLLAAFFLARMMNLQSGGAVIAPWEIEPGYEMEDWIDAVQMLEDVPKLQRDQRATDEFLKKRRKAHPYYSKYRSD